MQPRRGLLTVDPPWPPLQPVSCWKADLCAGSELTKGSAWLLELNSPSRSFIPVCEVLHVFSWLSANMRPFTQLSNFHSERPIGCRLGAAVQA